MRRSVKMAAVGLSALALLFAVPGVAHADHEPVPQDFFRQHVYMAGGTDRYFGQFNYDRELTTPGLDAPAGWKDGDRVAYRCSWSVLHYRGFIVGRVTYLSIGGPNGGGASVNDKYMLEGTRRYDGRLDPRHGTRIQFDEDCTNPPSGDGVSEVAPHLNLPDLPAGHEFEPMPPVVFYHGPHDIEVRDFDDLDDTIVPIDPSLRLQVERVTETGVWIGGYERLASGAWRARVEIRFDLIGDVEQGVAQGENIPGTAHPVEIRTTLESDASPELSPSPEPNPSPEPSLSPEPSASPEPSPEPLTADFDGDGDVDLDDLRAFIDALIDQFTG